MICQGYMLRSPAVGPVHGTSLPFKQSSTELAPADHKFQGMLLLLPILPKEHQDSRHILPCLALHRF